MQIQRFDHEPHPYPDPQGPVRAAGGQSGVGPVLSSPKRSDQPAARTETAGSPLVNLLERLKSVPDIRSHAVDAAREKVARGDYTTRAAAEQLAATNLRHEYF